MELRSTGQKLKFLESLARRIWNSRFENYSRFTGRKLVYKSGDEDHRQHTGRRRGPSVLRRCRP